MVTTDRRRTPALALAGALALPLLSGAFTTQASTRPPVYGGTADQRAATERGLDRFTDAELALIAAVVWTDPATGRLSALYPERGMVYPDACGEWWGPDGTGDYRLIVLRATPECEGRAEYMVVHEACHAIRQAEAGDGGHGPAWGRCVSDHMPVIEVR